MRKGSVYESKTTLYLTALSLFKTLSITNTAKLQVTFCGTRGFSSGKHDMCPPTWLSKEPETANCISWCYMTFCHLKRIDHCSTFTFNGKILRLSLLVRKCICHQKCPIGVTIVGDIIIISAGGWKKKLCLGDSSVSLFAQRASA